MIMMRLSIYELKYIGTGVISFCSLLYGVADAIVYKKFEEKGTHCQGTFKNYFIYFKFSATKNAILLKWKRHYLSLQT